MFTPPIVLNATERQLACWSGDVLWIAETQRNHPVVKSLVFQLSKKVNPDTSKPYDFLFVEAKELQKAQQTPVTTIQRLSSAEMEKMQGTALDLLREAARDNATDISINVQDKQAVVKFRVDGDLYIHKTDSAAWGDNLCRAIIQGMTENTSESHFTERVPIDATLARHIKLPVGVQEVRVSTLPTADAYEMYLRFQYARTLKKQTFEEMGLLKKDADMLRVIAAREKGMVLFIGPTNSGKTTLAYGLLQYLQDLHEGRRRITCVEDAIEVRNEHFTQVFVSDDFHVIDSALMRADLNIVYQNEMRKKDQIESGCRKAMTGHFFISTLHTNNFFDIPKRFMTEGVNETILMDNNVLLGAIACRLVPTLCDACKVTVAGVQPVMEKRARLFAEDMGPNVRFRGPGCDACKGRGTKGRTPLAAVLRFDVDIVGALLREDYALAHALWKMEGGNTLRTVAREKVATGIIDPIIVDGHINGFDEAADFPNHERIARAKAMYLTAPTAVPAADPVHHLKQASA